MQPQMFKKNLEVFKNCKGVILFEGILYIILGWLAIIQPVISSLATAIFLGILFLVGGILQLIRTIKAWGVAGSGLALFSAIITLVAGALMLTNPVVALFALTTILAVYFLLDGIAKISLCFSMYPKSHKFWICLSGIISLILAFFIFKGMPAIPAGRLLDPCRVSHGSSTSMC